MKRRLVLGIALMLVNMAGAQSLMNQASRSVSGQFVVRAASPDLFSSRSPDLLVNPALISLKPAFVAVSCERIKQSLGSQLKIGQWHSTIYIHLYSARSAADLITIRSERFTDGWAYNVVMPDVLEPRRFVRAITQVLLVEFANRTANLRSAEIPEWLAEGLSQQLMNSAPLDMFIPEPARAENGIMITRTVITTDYRTDRQKKAGVGRGRDFEGDQTKPHPLAAAQRVLLSNPPLTFEQMSWHSPQGEGPATDVFRSCAQLCVVQLLRLKDGPACMRAMLSDLPNRYNWQIAFLNGFQPHFQRALDVEKWWALQTAQFTGRDLAHTWSMEQSREKLDAVMRSQVEVRTEERDLPLRADVPLQTVIREWDQLRQVQVLKPKLNELDLIRIHVDPDLLQVVDGYRGTLRRYLDQISTSGPILRFRSNASRLSRAATDAIRELDELDLQRKG